jgi:hypothetical protein
MVGRPAFGLSGSGRRILQVQGGLTHVTVALLLGHGRIG